jgi:ABC-type glycerol-3-phosphate transport system substrate-binding protein
MAKTKASDDGENTGGDDTGSGDAPPATFGTIEPIEIQEEMERALQGQQTAQAALDSAVQRGNRVLREFERTARG